MRHDVYPMGDYSAMTLDPNGCTFWYTNEYYVTNGLAFNTRIGSFGFPSCTPVGAGGTVSGTVTATVGGAAIAGATVSLGARSTTTDASGNYSFTNLPAGTYPTMTAAYPGYTTATSGAIAVTDGGTSSRNFSLSSASSGNCYVDTSQADFQAGVPTNIDITTTPGSAVSDQARSAQSVECERDRRRLRHHEHGLGRTDVHPAISGKLVRADVELFCSGCTTN